MTKRCKFCGVKLISMVISEKVVYQCPICGYIEGSEALVIEASDPSTEDSDPSSVT